MSGAWFWLGMFIGAPAGMLIAGLGYASREGDDIMRDLDTA